MAIGTPLLRFRSDEQLVALFRAGHDEAFRAIHDRYQKRLLAYARQMLPRRQDAEDALQDVFVRAYSGLRSNDGELALRAWLFRVAHNRCIDELRRPAPPQPEVLALMRPVTPDPIAAVDVRESLRRLLEDVRRLPDQQRSALLMRELGGMSYADLACSMDVSVPAVKSLLVRARLSLARAAEARDTACSEIRTELMSAHDRGVRPSATARSHMRDCSGCRCFRRELRGMTRQLAALTPAAGPLGVLANVLGFSGGGATAGGATASGGAVAASGGGAAASAGGLALGSTHVATLILAAVATAGGAAAIQHTLVAPHHRPVHAHRAVVHHHPVSPPVALEPSTGSPATGQPTAAPAAAITGAVKAPAIKQTIATGTGGTAALKRKLRSTATGGARPNGPGAHTGGQGETGTTSSSTAGSATGVCAAPSASDTSSGTGSDTTTTSSTGDGTGTSTPGTTSTGTATSQCAGVLAQGSTGEGSSSSTQTSTGTPSNSSNADSSSGSSGTGSGGGTTGTGTSGSTGASTTASSTSSPPPGGSSV